MPQAQDNPGMLLFRQEYEYEFWNILFAAVDDASDAPIRGFKVYESGAEATNPLTKEPGTYYFTVEADGYDTGFVTVFVDDEDQDVEVRLTKSASAQTPKYTVTFIVTDGKDGSALSGYTLVFDNVIRYSPVRDIAPGTYKFSVALEGYGTRREDVNGVGDVTVANDGVTVYVVMWEKSATMYWGNNPRAETPGFGWDDMDDAKGGRGWNVYYDAYAFNTAEITSEGMEIIFRGTGFRFIIVPVGLGPLTKILDGIGNNDIANWQVDSITIGSDSYILYKGANASDSIAPTGTKATLVY